MFISDLKPNQAVDSITIEIVDKGQEKEFTNFRGKVRVTNAKVKDETGQCTLTLWNDEIDKYSIGQKIRITNGWCKEYHNELQISSGKYGRIEILGPDGNATAEETKIEDAPAEKPKKKRAKKHAKEKTEDDEKTDDEPAEEDIFSEAEKDPYIKYEKEYGKDF